MTEMNKLRKALDAAGIKWEDRSAVPPFGWVGITRTRFTNKDGIEVSVICGEHTYGGQAGLLETMPPVHPYEDDDPFADDVEGWLTADEIIEAWL